MRTNILGVEFDDLTMEQAVERAAAMIADGSVHYAVTPNAEFVQRAGKDARFRAVLNRADLVLPDGIGVVCASKVLGCPLRERVSGCDFAAALCARLAREHRRLFLLGARPGVAELAARRLESDYPGLTVCGVHDGYFDADAPVVNAIRAARAHVVFVCLGAPRQEYWMAEHGKETGAAFLIGLGGTLDVLAGVVRRAPKSWQKAGLEWLYRLLRQPSRLGRVAKLPLFWFSALKANGKKGS